MKELEEIREILHAEKSRLMAEYGVSEIGLFGSHVSGRATEKSDLDVLVDFHRKIDLFRFVHLKNDLSGLLGMNVDLVMKRAMKPTIGKKILQEVVYL